MAEDYAALHAMECELNSKGGTFAGDFPAAFSEILFLAAGSFTAAR